MQVTPVGTRGRYFSFPLGDDATGIYVIDGHHRWVVVDTALGPGAIAEVRSHLGARLESKPVVVVNTHSHFDHVWGNCAFAGSTIIAHRLCRESFTDGRVGRYLANHSERQMGPVALVPPTLTFESRLCLADDGIELIHSPGHTLGSISVIDRDEGVLYAGDNIGLPIPSLYPGTTAEAFIGTLETYLALDLSRLVTSHYGEVSWDLVADHLTYLRAVCDGDTFAYDHGDLKVFNDWNLRMLARG